MSPMKLTPSPFVWFNGELVPWEKAQVHVLTHALHYGSSVFEGIRAYAARAGTAVFGLQRHVDRLFQSCRIVNMPVPWTPEQVSDAIVATVRANRHDACYIRPLVYRGYGALGVWPDECPVEMAIATFPWVKSNEQELLERGVEVGVSSWRRMAPDTHPAMAKVSGNYVNSQLVVSEAKRHGYADGLVLDVDGYVSEGSGQNVFLVHEGKLLTPPVGASILAGITRRAVIEFATDLGVAVIEQRVPREMLHVCDELFLTGTVAEITPVRSVDGKPVGAGKRGPVTARLQQRFYAIARGEIEDRHGWLTPV
jgi:branched-chain amino acid aminotransferase